MVSSRLTGCRRTHGSTLQDPTCGSQALMAWLRYQSQNHSPSQGKSTGTFCRLSVGSLSVMHLLPCWSMHSWLCFQHIIKFHELLGFCDFWGLLDIKVKIQYLVQCTRTRVAPKNLSVMVCTGLHWISLP